MIHELEKTLIVVNIATFIMVSLNNYKDIVRNEVDSIGKRLKDYCDLEEVPRDRRCRVAYGGDVPDRIWHGIMLTTAGKEIQLNITQTYAQPGVRLIYCEAEMRYLPGVGEDNLNITRKALTDAGLARKL